MADVYEKVLNVMREVQTESTGDTICTSNRNDWNEKDKEFQLLVLLSWTYSYPPILQSTPGYKLKKNEMKCMRLLISTNRHVQDCPQ